MLYKKVLWIFVLAILGTIILTGCITDKQDGDEQDGEMPDDTVEPTPTTEAGTVEPPPTTEAGVEPPGSGPDRKGKASELTTPTPTATEKPQPPVEPPPEVTELPEPEPDICIDHSGIEWQGSTCLCSGLWDDVVICNDGLKIDNVSNRPCTPEASCPGSDSKPDPGGGKVTPPVTPEDPENKACSGKGKKTGNKHCSGT